MAPLLMAGNTAGWFGVLADAWTASKKGLINPMNNEVNVHSWSLSTTGTYTVTYQRVGEPEVTYTITTQTNNRPVVYSSRDVSYFDNITFGWIDIPITEPFMKYKETDKVDWAKHGF